MWRKYLKITFFFLIFFLVFGLGFFLPESLFAMSDAKKMEMVVPSKEQSLILPGAEQISMEKKLQYLYQERNSSEMQFMTVEISDEDWIKTDQIIQRELQNLQKYNLLPKASAFLTQNQKKEGSEKSIFDQYYKKQMYVEKYFIVDQSGDGGFVSLWLIHMTNPKLEQLYFWLDDESGKILSLGFRETKERKNRKKAKKRFRKYLREELSMDLEEIPDFPCYADTLFYSICPESLMEILEQLGFSDIYSKESSQVTSSK